MIDDIKADSVRRGGRPSRQAAEQLGQTILDVATSLFLADGYGATSIEAIAARAKISKRTFYHRFADKPALFAAVVTRIIDTLRPPAGTPLFEDGTLEAVLHRLAIFMIRAAISPTVLALHRLILAEATQFPELAAALAEIGARREAIDGIAALLRRETDAGRIAVENAEFAAEQFMQLAMGGPQRRAYGAAQPMTAAEIELWASASVDLILNGLRTR